jgi:hypothetical protein
VKGFMVVLLLAASLLQPSLALPATCTMPGLHRVMTCACCCASGPCCSVSERARAERLTAVANTAAVEKSMVAAVSFSVAITSELFPPAPGARLLTYSTVSHAPPPLAVSCIRLI